MGREEGQNGQNVRNLRGCFSWFQAVEGGKPGSENPVGPVKDSFYFVLSEAGNWQGNNMIRLMF